VDIATTRLDQEKEIDLRAIGARLWSKRWWIVLAIILSTAAFAAVAFSSTKMYRATTVVVIAENPTKGGMGGIGGALGELGGLAAIAGLDVTGGAAGWAEPMAVIQSREFTERFMRDLNLMPKLFPKQWDAQAQRWKGPPETWPNLARGFKVFDKRIRTVTRDKISGMIKVEIEWTDPDEAATWANTLVSRLNAEMRSRAIATATASIGYLEHELATTSEVEARQAISRVMEAQINQRMLANVTDEYSVRVVDRALPPDRRDVVWPNKVMLLLMGPAFGLLLGIFVALVAGAFDGSKR
jgi:uncharacterized protein involved in exopolysaccharide biosynthesis